MDRQNFGTLLTHHEATKEWPSEKDQHDQSELEKATAYRKCQHGEWSVIGHVFEDVSEDIDWPCESYTAVETDELRRLFSIELELPDKEKLSSVDVAAYRRGIGLSAKPLSQLKNNRSFANTRTQWSSG